MIHYQSNGLPLYLFDRSRLEATKDCPRKRYWNCDFLGVGIVKNKDIPPYWPFHTGHFIHEGIESLLVRGLDGHTAAEDAGNNYYNQYAPLLTDPEIQPERQALLQMELQQEVDLVKALIYGWSLVGLPRLQSNYTVIENGVEHEEEISWLLNNEAEMKLLTRTDILCKSLTTGSAVLFNLKSTSDPNDKWRNSFNRDMQTLTEALAVEARLGVKVDGVIIEGLVKGNRSEWPKGSGFWQHNSSLIYAWVKEAEATALPGEDNETIFAPSWDWTCTGPHLMGNRQKCPGSRNHTLGKGFRKRPVRDCYPGGLYSWIDYLMRSQPSLLESYFVQLPPIARDEFQVERWKRQKLYAEKLRQDAAAQIDKAFIEGNKELAYILLDQFFDMNEGYQCHSCSYNSLCWEAGDPFDVQVWKPRTPNHLLEAEMLLEGVEKRMP